MKWRPFSGELEDRAADCSANFGRNGYHLIPCPSCSSPLRIYVRQYGYAKTPRGQLRRGSGWIWCSVEHLFYYWTGLVPEWWPMIDPVPNVQHLSPSGVDVDEYWDVIYDAITKSQPH
jgi:hypothetical protein